MKTHNNIEDVNVLAKSGTKYYKEWEFTYNNHQYLMPEGTERQLIIAVIYRKNYASAKNILINWKHPELASFAFMKFFEEMHLNPHFISDSNNNQMNSKGDEQVPAKRLNFIEKDGYDASDDWNFTFNNRVYNMPIDIERQLFQAIIINKSLLVAEFVLNKWNHKELSSYAFMQFFEDTHMPEASVHCDTIETDTVKTGNTHSKKKQKRRVELVIAMWLSIALIIFLIFCSVKSCSKSDETSIEGTVQNSNNYNTQQSYEQPVPQEEGIQYGDSLITNKGNTLRYYGYDVVNFVFETDVRITQEEFDDLVIRYNLNTSARFQLTFQKGELFATYAYVDSGKINYSPDAPKSKEDVKTHVEKCDYEDVKEFIDRAYEMAPKIKSDWDEKAAVGCFRDAADRLEEYRVKYGVTSRYKTLKQYFYQRQKSKLGRTYAKTIDDGAITIAQEMAEQRIAEQRKEQQERIVNADGHEYYLPKQTVACYTKEDLKLFNELCYAGDEDGYNQMVYSGRAVLVGPGPCAMLDRGFTVTKIRINGKILYLDSSDVKSK